MDNDLTRIREEAVFALEACHDEASLDSIRVRVLGKKGDLTSVLRSLGGLPPELRRTVGEQANQIKEFLEAQISTRRTRIQEEQRARSLAAERIDITEPGARRPRGSLHP